MGAAVITAGFSICDGEACRHLHKVTSGIINGYSHTLLVLSREQWNASEGLKQGGVPLIPMLGQDALAVERRANRRDSSNEEKARTQGAPTHG